MKKKNQFLFKKVTNNLVDVFFGEEGFDSKEWVRLKRGQGTWIPCGDRQRRVHQDEFDFGCITKMEDVLPLIIKEMKGI